MTFKLGLSVDVVNVEARTANEIDDVSKMSDFLSMLASLSNGIVRSWQDIVTK